MNQAPHDLFQAEAAERRQQQSPLANRMRPLTLDDYVGQEHIIGPGRLLRRSIEADQLSSLILYGPPGTGKTTLASVIANTSSSAFVTLNAVLAGVKVLREEIEAAGHRFAYRQQRTTLFVDEVHRWNKAQQDALLPPRRKRRRHLYRRQLRKIPSSRSSSPWSAAAGSSSCGRWTMAPSRRS